MSPPIEMAREAKWLTAPSTSSSFSPSSIIPAMTITNFQMPNVFVVPPEEDHSPAWCYFDAAEREFDHLTQVELINSALVLVNSNATDDHVEYDIDYNPEVNTFQRKWDYHEQGEQPLQDSLHHQHSSPWNYRDVTDDSDVIEVIKVGRGAVKDESVVHVNPYGHPTDSNVTHSKTLRLRASRMFKSLRKVGKRKRDPEHSFPTRVASGSAMLPYHASETLSNSSRREWVPNGSGAPTLPRRNSILRPQLFNMSKRRASHLEDGKISYSQHPHYRLSGSDSCPEVDQDGAEDIDTNFPSRAASPSPSFLAKRRFSMVNLQKIFSFSTATPAPARVASPSCTSSTASNSSNTTFVRPCSPSSSTPESSRGPCFATADTHLGLVASSSVPMAVGDKLATNLSQDPNSLLAEHPSLAAELGINLGTDLDLEFPTVACATNIDSAMCNTCRKLCDALTNTHDGVTKTALGDVSFEMRLDSLHFDDLSFDVNRF